jgi:3'-5' exoribonuclease
MPMFPEALMLHYLDDLDSKMEAMRAQFQRDPESEWTAYNPSLERPLLNSKKFLQNIGKADECVTEEQNTNGTSAVAAAAASTEE